MPLRAHQPASRQCSHVMGHDGYAEAQLVRDFGHADTIATGARGEGLQYPQTRHISRGSKLPRQRTYVFCSEFWHIIQILV